MAYFYIECATGHEVIPLGAAPRSDAISTSVPRTSDKITTFFQACNEGNFQAPKVFSKKAYLQKCKIVRYDLPIVGDSYINLMKKFNSPISGLSDRMLLALSLIVLGFILVVTIIPGVFIIDEDNYLVTVVGLRHGTLMVPGTENLTPSKELVFFDPEASRRTVQSTPVVSLVPPIYAFLALPFSFVGLRGLVFLNILSFLLTTYLVFRYVESIAHQRETPWIASVIFALGGYCIEYAQGLWPQMLSVFLCTATLFLCLKARNKNSVTLALFAGVAMGLAIGVREQNIFFAGCVGIGLVYYSTKKYRVSTGYAIGVLLLLMIIATMNFYRVGGWHPFPKVTSYAGEVSATAATSWFLEPLRVFWSKVVDYSSYGPNTDHIKSGLYQWDKSSSTVLMNGIVKKSLVQSSPWIGLALVAMVVSLLAGKSKSSEVTKEIRLLGLIVVPTLFMFVAAGFNRTDGLSFNQRYFLELVPLCAIAAALFVDAVPSKLIPALIGLLTGTVLVVLVLVLPLESWRHLGQRFVPIVLTLAFILAWYLSRNSILVFILLGMCVGWALFFHVESDLVGSRFRREINAARYELLEKTIPNHSALFTYWGNKDAAGPLQLVKDVVILDVKADDGLDAKTLEDELLKQGRRIFILENDMPREILHRLVLDQRFRQYSEGNVRLAELSSGTDGILLQ
jgi:hypothetical protein